MGVVALLEDVAGVVVGVDELEGDGAGHGDAAAGGGVLGHPAQGEGQLAPGADLDGHRVGGAADAAALDLDFGLHVVDGRVHDFEGVLAGLFGEFLDGAVDDALGGGFLAGFHERAHDLGDELAVEAGVGLVDALDGLTTSHLSRLLISSYPGRRRLS